MKQIIIGFSKPKKFKIGARLISWWMGTEYSHVYLKFQEVGNNCGVFHAAHGMVHFRSEENFLKDNIAVKEYTINLTNKMEDNFYLWCMSLAGETYSVMELVQILYTDVIYALTKKEPKSEDLSGYICSELVGKFCQQALHIIFTKPLYLLKPVDIDKELGKIYD